MKQVEGPSGLHPQTRMLSISSLPATPIPILWVWVVCFSLPDPAGQSQTCLWSVGFLPLGFLQLGTTGHTASDVLSQLVAVVSSRLALQLCRGCHCWSSRQEAFVTLSTAGIIIKTPVITMTVATCNRRYSEHCKYLSPLSLSDP